MSPDLQQTDPYLDALAELRRRGIGAGPSGAPTGSRGRGGGPGPSIPQAPATVPGADDPFLAALQDLRAGGDSRSWFARGFDEVFTAPEFITKGAREIANVIDAPRLSVRDADAEAIARVAGVPASEIRDRFERDAAMKRGFAAGAVEGAASLLTPGDVALTATGMGPLARGLRGVRGAGRVVDTAQAAANLATVGRGAERLASSESLSEAAAGAAQVALGTALTAAGRPQVSRAPVVDMGDPFLAALKQIRARGAVSPSLSTAPEVRGLLSSGPDFVVSPDGTAVPIAAASASSSRAAQLANDPSFARGVPATFAESTRPSSAVMPAAQPDSSALPVGSNARKAPIQGRRKTPKAPIHAVVSEADEILSEKLSRLRAEGEDGIVRMRLDEISSRAGRGVSSDVPEVYQLAQLRAFDPVQIERIGSWVDWRLANLPAKPRAIAPSLTSALAPEDRAFISTLGRLREVRDISEAGRAELSQLFDDLQGNPALLLSLRESNPALLSRVESLGRDLLDLQPVSLSDASERMRLAASRQTPAPDPPAVSPSPTSVPSVGESSTSSLPSQSSRPVRDVTPLESMTRGGMTPLEMMNSGALDEAGQEALFTALRQWEQDTAKPKNPQGPLASLDTSELAALPATPEDHAFAADWAMALELSSGSERADDVLALIDEFEDGIARLGARHIDFPLASRDPQAFHQWRTLDPDGASAFREKVSAFIEAMRAESSPSAPARPPLSPVVEPPTRGLSPSRAKGGKTEQFRARVLEAFDRSDSDTRDTLTRLWDDVLGGPTVPADSLRDWFASIQHLRSWLPSIRRENPQAFSAFERAVDDIVRGDRPLSFLEKLDRLPVGENSPAVRIGDRIDALQGKHFKQIQALGERRLESLRNLEPEEMAAIERAVDDILGGASADRPDSLVSASLSARVRAAWAEDPAVRDALEASWHESFWPNLDRPLIPLSTAVDGRGVLLDSLFQAAGLENPAGLRTFTDLVSDALARVRPHRQSRKGATPAVGVPVAADASDVSDAVFAANWRRWADAAADDVLYKASADTLDDYLSDLDLPPGTSFTEKVRRLRETVPARVASFERRMLSELERLGIEPATAPPSASIRPLPKAAGPNVRQFVASLSSVERQFQAFAQNLTPEQASAIRARLEGGKPVRTKDAQTGKVLTFQTKAPTEAGYIRPELLAHLAGAVAGGLAGGATIDEDDAYWERAAKVLTGAALGVGVTAAGRRAFASRVVPVDLNAPVLGEGVQSVLMRFKNHLVRDAVQERLMTYHAGVKPSSPLSPALTKFAGQIARDVMVTGRRSSPEAIAVYARAIKQNQMRLADLASRVTSSRATDLDLLHLMQARADADVLRGSLIGGMSDVTRALGRVRSIGRILDSGSAEIIRGAADQIRVDAVRFAKDFAAQPVNDLQRYQWLRKDQHPSLWERVRSYYYANILSGPKTHARNILGNVFNLTFGLISHPAAAGIEAARSAVSGRAPRVRFAELPRGVVGAIGGLEQGFLDALFTARHGINPIALSKQVQAHEVGKLDYPQYEFAGGGANPFNWPGRTLDTADAFFRSLARNIELYEGAYTMALNEGLIERADIEQRMLQLLTGTSPESAALREQAEHVAARAVFQEKGGEIVRQLSKLYHVPGVGQVLTFVVPFLRTPSNIIHQGLEASPAGFLMREARRGGRTGALARGRAVTGSLALGYLAYLASSGRLSGEGPRDPNERERLYAEGWKPRSVRIGDTWVDYALFQPISVQMSLIANAYEAWQEAGSEPQAAFDVASGVIGSAASTLSDQSFLDGIANLANAITNPERYGERLVGRVATGFVPFSSAQRSLSQGIDPTVRRVDSIGDQFKAVIPGASKSLPARLDRFGEDIQREGGPLRRMGDPLNLTPVRSDVLSDELHRLGVEVPQLSVPLKLPGGRALTEDEAQRVRQEQGRQMRVAIAAVLQHPNYERLPDVTKRRLIERAIGKARADVARRVRADVIHRRGVFAQ